MSLLITLPDKSDRAEFYSGNIFHERHMNSCPIGCQGCAVSAVTNAAGSINYKDLLEFYQDAHEHGVSLKITKVEGYDPVFVKYADYADLSFAQSVKDAVNFGHQIITPVCTTGHWKSERSRWQIEELGKLDNHYRAYTYPSGNTGVGFALSVPREIRPFANNKYEFAEHLTKISTDIELLTVAGDIEVLIYFNSKIEGDLAHAEKIKEQLDSRLSKRAIENAQLLITDFNAETLPESCYRYKNSILLSDKGFLPIDQESLEWSIDPNLLEPGELTQKLVTKS